MSDMQTAKAAARKAAADRRAAAHAEHGPHPGSATEALRHWIAAGPRPRAIAAYLPMRTEIDPRPALIDAAAAGVPLAMPVVVERGHPLIFRAWTPDTPLVPGAFGAHVPASGALVEPDLLVVPLLAFDRRGYRLGYGGGFYDRTIAALAARHPLRTVGLAYAAQECDAVPVEATDMPLDAVITEKGVVFSADSV
ncbi:5-formyltetrahydrofolate cyclo-ligase [Oceanomicrobium pacificus]|uniref:5-formyltetrahydrofolate cyclo-ligase n=1 Tax=Oceanomicrobium pacificus TaxID=2692916 RepID=A0A6B0TYL2_9RHOB|nr:5-formyltetrahydrofolate cyclo-ligase [Oceanomicrobium pacificus]MXU66093.1 5-formyltetrahydrofolate cyclo-ligase [Oceanomicrobium pacificus]